MTRVEREEIKAAQRRHNLTFNQARDLVADLHNHEKKMEQKLKEIRAKRAKEAEAKVQAQSACTAESEDHS